MFGNASFKIIFKILANKLAKPLSYLVDEYQTGFVYGRYILDGVVLAQGIIHLCAKKKSSRFLLKLDFQKAYDSVDWECLMEMLSARGGFGSRWDY